MIKDIDSNEIDFEERLSPHFTVGEMMRSGKAVGMGVKNVPEENPAPGEASREEVIENLRELCRCVLEPLRRRVGRVIVVGGYRCEAVNRLFMGLNIRNICGVRRWIFMSQDWKCVGNMRQFSLKQTSIR